MTRLFVIVCAVAIRIATAANCVPGEVLAGIPHQYLTLPAGTAEAGLESVVAHESLAGILHRHGVTLVRRAIPSSVPEDTLAFARGGEKVKLIDVSTIFLLKMSPDHDAEALVYELRRSFCVTFAELNCILDFCIDPLDPRYADQWALGNVGNHDINAPEAWDYGTGSAGIRVGIYDTGIDPDHLDFAGGKIAGGRGYLGDPDDITDDLFHGTFVSGLACARTNNGYGIAGVSGGWASGLGCELWVFKVGDEGGYPLSAVVEAIADGYSTYGIDVMNCSWRAYDYSTALREVMTNALTLGTVIVCSKGNDGSNVVHFPSDFGDCARGNVAIAVGASDQDDQRWENSNRGNNIDIVAPGVDVLSTTPTYLTQYMQQEQIPTEFWSASGTSAAAPIAAGTAALLLSWNPMLAPDDVAGILQSSARDLDPPGYDDYTGYGRLDALAALRRAAGPYHVCHLTAAGGVDVGTVGPYGARLPIPMEPGQMGWTVERHEIRSTVSFPFELEDLSVWGRTAGTVGWSRGDSNYFTGYSTYLYGEGWCDTVGGTLTPNSVVLRTYVYDVWRVWESGGTEHLGWRPCPPSGVAFSYTVNGRRAFTGQSSLEPEEPLPYENRLEYASGVTGWRAVVTPSDAGVEPHSGQRMYKVTGTDASVPPNDGSASFKFFDYTYTLPSACYLSYWIYVKESPGGLGHITLDGLLESGIRLKDWTQWGVIIDTSGQIIHPASHTVPQGRWVRCIFSLNPAAGQVLKSLSVVYDDGDPAEAGPFAAYIDDVQITTEFPAKNTWYAETFGNGVPSATGFEIGLAYTDFQGGPCNGGARIKVNGHGDGQPGEWINPTPSLRKDLDPTIVLDQNDGLAWRQYDHAYALKLSLTVEDAASVRRPLIYSANSADSWPKQGWVKMSDDPNPTPHYDVWESFSRSITTDFLAEYGSVPLPLKVVNMRIAHFCNEGGNADSGGVVADIGITGHWLAQQAMPSGSKAIKDGGWLAYDAGKARIYASRGNKQPDFFAYDPVNDAWEALAPWLPGIEGKMPQKGSAGCADGDGIIYATKGNNKAGFYKYEVAANAWTQLLDVPLGISNKKVKGGASIAWAYNGEVGSPYLLKGYKNEFYRYDTAANTWQTLTPAPVGRSERWDKGSWLVSDGVHTLYAHKARYHEFYSYDTETDVWSGPLTAIPIPGTNGSKKAKDGSCGAWLDGCIYAFKGGNTQELWKCTFATDGNSWTELDTIPRGLLKKRVKAGAGLAAVPGFGLFATKGNKSNEFWHYKPAPLGVLDAGAPSPGGSAIASGGTTLDGETPLTDGLEASKPRWNPQGNRVCYSKDDTLTGYEAIYQCYYGLPIPEEKVTDMLEHCEEPVYSPNGSYIAFQVDDTVSDFYQLFVTTTSGGGGAGCGIDEVPEKPADCTDAAGTATAVAPVKAASTRSATAGSIIASRPVWQTTFAEAEHLYPEWSIDGQWLTYERDVDCYTQVWRVPAFGGTEEQLTSGNSDHFLPSYLNSNEIVFILSPNDDYDVVGKVNVSTHQATVVSNFQTDHDRPSPAWNGNSAVAEALDDAGNTQIVKIPIWVGSESWLTSGTSDIMEPDYSQDNRSVFAVRWTGITSQIVCVDAQNGGYYPVTDSLAIRDNPDGHTSGLTSTAVYEREAWNPMDLLLGGGRRRPGSGIYLSRFRLPKDGQQGASLGVFALERSEPNPATNRVRIRWQVPAEAEVSLRVYNTAGQLVKVLADSRTKPGAYTSVWNGTDNKGRRLANGVYFYALDNGAKRISRKLVLTD